MLGIALKPRSRRWSGQSKPPLLWDAQAKFEQLPAGKTFGAIEGIPDTHLVVGFLLIGQLVLVESGDSRPTDCQNQPTAKIIGNMALGSASKRQSGLVRLGLVRLGLVRLDRAAGGVRLHRRIFWLLHRPPCQQLADRALWPTSVFSDSASKKQNPANRPCKVNMEAIQQTQHPPDRSFSSSGRSRPKNSRSDAFLNVFLANQAERAA